MSDSPFPCWVDCDAPIGQHFMAGSRRRYELTEEQVSALHAAADKDQYIRELREAGAFPEMEIGELPVAYGGHQEDR